MNKLYPIVVPATYFELPRGMRKKAIKSSPDAWGIVRPLGHNLFSLLVREDGDFIKNVHEDDLAKMRLTRASAERAALKNLSALAKSSKEIERKIGKVNSRFSISLWLGGRFTSSCILWPGLYQWACRELETDQLVVMAPQTNVMCVSDRGDAKFRSGLRDYVAEIVKGMDKMISMEWFELTRDGIAPLSDE